MAEDKLIVLGILESVLGPGKRRNSTKKGDDYFFYCPICHWHSAKLVVNIETGYYNCFTCFPKTSGKSLFTLLKKVGADRDKIDDIKKYYNIDTSKISKKDYDTVELPKEFMPLYTPDTSLEARKAMVYLSKRGITIEDLKKYNIGYCKNGRYKNRIIVPSYNKNGVLNYFIARSFEKNPYLKYDAPSCDKTEIIGFEYYINWNIPVILCEGAFDAITIKRNVVPLFGKTIPHALMKKLVESQVKTVYLALDKDAIKSSISFAEELLNYGKEVYLLDLKEKDPSEIGFKNMIDLLHTALPLSFSNLLNIKIQVA